MTNHDLQSLIHDAIINNIELEEVSIILKKYKQSGGQKTEAISTFETMRINSEEQYEDRLLEIMDIASGHCDSRFIVW